MIWERNSFLLPPPPPRRAGRAAAVGGRGGRPGRAAPGSSEARPGHRPGPAPGPGSQHPAGPPRPRAQAPRASPTPAGPAPSWKSPKSLRAAAGLAARHGTRTQRALSGAPSGPRGAGRRQGSAPVPGPAGGRPGGARTPPHPGAPRPPPPRLAAKAPLTWLPGPGPPGSAGRGDRQPRPLALRRVRGHEVGPSPPPAGPRGLAPVHTPIGCQVFERHVFPPLGSRPCTPTSPPTPHLDLGVETTAGVPAPGSRPPQPPLTWIQEPRGGGGGSKVALGPGRGGARNPGCQPPRKPRRRGGRGRRPRPLPSLAAGGGGGSIGAAHHVSGAPIGWAGSRVRSPPARGHEGAASERSRGPRARGAHVGGAARAGVPRLQPRAPNSRPPARLRPTPFPPPPHSPLGTGSAWPRRPPKHSSAQAQGCDRPGGGGEARAAPRAVVRRRGPPRGLRGGPGARALGGAGARGPGPPRPSPPAAAAAAGVGSSGLRRCLAPAGPSPRRGSGGTGVLAAAAGLRGVLQRGVRWGEL